MSLDFGDVSAYVQAIYVVRDQIRQIIKVYVEFAVDVFGMRVSGSLASLRDRPRHISATYIFMRNDAKFARRDKHIPSSYKNTFSLSLCILSSKYCSRCSSNVYLFEISGFYKKKMHMYCEKYLECF